jgi:restriction endonuclease S subunit
MHIKQFAQVIGGYVFREAIKPDNNGDIYVFQAKDLTAGEAIKNISSLTKIAHNIPEYAGHLKKNDILLIARGMRSGSFRSAVFASDVPNVIASSSIHVIRITAAGVMPEYVSRYLNSKVGQDALSQIVSGSYIGALPRKEVEKIKIPIPALEKQQAVVDLDRNIREQERIINRQNEIKHNLVNATFTSLAAK